MEYNLCNVLERHQKIICAGLGASDAFMIVLNHELKKNLLGLHVPTDPSNYYISEFGQFIFCNVMQRESYN